MSRCSTLVALEAAKRETHAACKMTGESGILELPLPPVRIAIPKGAPNGAVLGSAQASVLQDITFACTGADNQRELRVIAPTDVTFGLGEVYATTSISA